MLILEESLMKFSERGGYKKLRSKLQFEEIDEKLRISLWNQLTKYYFYDLRDSVTSPPARELLQFIFSELLYRPLDTTNIHLKSLYEQLRAYYFSCSWWWCAHMGVSDELGKWKRKFKFKRSSRGII